MTTTRSTKATFRRRALGLAVIGIAAFVLATPTLAQRVTKPSEPPPPAPPPPVTQPRSGVVEPPKPGTSEAPAPTPQQTPTKPAEPQTQTELLRVIFTPGSASLSETARGALDKLAATIKDDAKKRLLLKSYTSTGSSVSETRRLSLQRGLAVRGYLADKGVASHRIDVQPLGRSDDDGPGDRVDVLPGHP